MQIYGPTFSQIFAGAIPAPFAYLPLKGAHAYRSGANGGMSLITAAVTGSEGGPFAAYALASGDDSHPLRDMYFFIEGINVPKDAGWCASLAAGFSGRVSAKLSAFAGDGVRFTEGPKQSLFYESADGVRGGLSSKDELMLIADSRKRDTLLRSAVVFVPSCMADSLKVEPPDQTIALQIYFALEAVAAARKKIAEIGAAPQNRKAAGAGKKKRDPIEKFKAARKAVPDPAVSLIAAAGRIFRNCGPCWSSFAADAFLMAADALRGAKGGANGARHRRAEQLLLAARDVYPRADTIGREKLFRAEKIWGMAEPVKDTEEEGEEG